MKNIYLERYAISKNYLSEKKVSKDLKLIVVIPCHDESNLIKTLISLDKCDTDFAVEVITVINASEVADESIKEKNRNTYNEAIVWSGSNSNSNINYHFILENELPKKHAGVGLARKIGMDDAVRMFESIGNQDGIILCYDADCTCTPNLLSEVVKHFEHYKKSPACSIHFEHPLEGDESDEVYEGIIYYELHLRYYIDALKFSNFPYAHQTIGSSMAVKSWAYQKQGGMNKRKAGEDFYFLHKIMPLGNFTSLNSAFVIPSPRKSHRVPFGTGRAIGEWLDNEESVYSTYSYHTFLDLKIFFEQSRNWINVIESELLLSEFLDLPKSIQEFVGQETFVEKMKEINRQSTSELAYKKRFFQWWDGFKVLKYVHFCRDNFYPDMDVNVAADWLMNESQIVSQQKDPKSKLLILRKFDKSLNFNLGLYH